MSRLSREAVDWLIIILILLIFIFIILNCVGCSSLIPTEHKEQAAVRTAGELAAHQADSTVRRSALPAITVSGRENKLDLTVPPGARFDVTSDTQSGVDSQGRDSASGSSMLSIPLFVKLIGLGVGIVLFIGIIAYARKSSMAANAAFSLADRELADSISSLDNMIRTTDDPGRRQALTAHLADLEKRRGKIAANRKR